MERRALYPASEFCVPIAEGLGFMVGTCYPFLEEKAAKLSFPFEE